MGFYLFIAVAAVVLVGSLAWWAVGVRNSHPLIGAGTSDVIRGGCWSDQFV
jgi:hypothetical protein